MMNIKKTCLFVSLIIGLHCLGMSQSFAHAQDDSKINETIITITAENKAPGKYYGLFTSQEDAYAGLQDKLVRPSYMFPSVERVNENGKVVFSNIQNKDYWLGQVIGHHIDEGVQRDTTIYFYDSKAEEFTETKVKVELKTTDSNVNPGSTYGLYSKENDALNAVMNPNKYSDIGRVRKKTPLKNRENIDFGFLDKKDYFMAEIAAPAEQNRTKAIQKFDSEKQTFIELKNVGNFRLGELEIRLREEGFPEEKNLSGAKFAVYKKEEEAKKGLMDKNLVLTFETDDEGKAKKDFPLYSDETFYVKQMKSSKGNVLSDQILETKINKNETSKIEFVVTQPIVVESRVGLNNFPFPNFKRNVIATQKSLSETIPNETIKFEKKDLPKALTEKTQNISKVNTQINNNLKKETILNRKVNSDYLNKTGLAVTGREKTVLYTFAGFGGLLVLTGIAMMIRKSKLNFF